MKNCFEDEAFERTCLIDSLILGPDDKNLARALLVGDLLVIRDEKSGEVFLRWPNMSICGPFMNSAKALLLVLANPNLKDVRITSYGIMGCEAHAV